ncbi:hypothetical protein NX722_04985 [Endozoicomonas gorgoniicola]|uniref:Uncharacterized protein n=1 Tax=Endozoicomonas gorgoniicola TaxID=1234144 RepID=A0ABT3MRK4_9GAMM|nr:hypothetical protein [Endozoicomonas gorgoniicola]MCW7552005.1 hypothetical protein [Endozoicomonas gorgoniicola]
MSAVAESNDPDHTLNTLTDLIRIVGETRSDVKVIDRKVDCNQQENRERFDRLEQKLDSSVDRLDSRIDQLEHKLDSRIDKLEHKLDSRIDKLELLIRQLHPNANN